MRNLDESRRNENLNTSDIAETVPKTDPEVVRFERRDMAPAEGNELLLPKDEVEKLREHWTEIQTNFVDEPQKSVEEADKLVASAIQRIAEVFSEGRVNLEGQWSRGDKVSTEDLRVSLQHYRAFFSRLLAI